MLATESDAKKQRSADEARIELQQFWERLSAPLRPFLEEVTHSLQDQVNAFEPEVSEFARYALENQGKQLRPLLVGLSAHSTGKLTTQHVKIAVIIEMIHLATLVHDDIMDHADVRRSKPTLANNWGNEVAVMLGDCLFAHALKLASEFPTVDVCRFVSEATKTVCSGEIIQNFRKNDLNDARARYFKVISMKTAELFALACDQGAFHNNASQEVRKQLRLFGIHFGTAYQIFDDILDLFGNEDSAGKSLGTDLLTGKLTLPIIHILESDNSRNPENILKELSSGHPQAMSFFMAQAQEFGTVSHCRDAVQQELNLAKKSLNEAGIRDETDPMYDLVLFIAKLTQTYFPN